MIPNHYRSFSKLPLAPEPPFDLQAAEDETDRLRRENGELRNMLKLEAKLEQIRSNLQSGEPADIGVENENIELGFIKMNEVI